MPGLPKKNKRDQSDTVIKVLCRSATLSRNGVYRYSLYRQIQNNTKQIWNFIMLNPSTADSSLDDATIRKCYGFAFRGGADEILVTNLFAYRATNPKSLYNCPHDPVGACNNDKILNCAKRSDKIILAWGNHGCFMDRDDEVVSLLDGFDLYSLGKNKNGSPVHPLMVPYSKRPVLLKRGK